METEAHVEVWTAFVNMPEGTMLPFFTFLSHEVRTYL